MISTFRDRGSAVALLLAGVLLTGCNSTERQVKEAELSGLEAAVKASEELLADVKAGTVPPESDIKVYLSMEVINKVMAGVSGIEIPLPNDPSITLKLGGFTLSSLGALPSVTIKGSATKGDLTAELEIVGVLKPLDPATRPAELQVHILSLAPKLRWGAWEPTKADFVKTLLSAELIKLSDKLPTITLPLSQSVDLGAAASTQTVDLPVGDATLHANVEVPDTLRQRQLKVLRYVFFDNGIAVYGSLQ